MKKVLTLICLLVLVLTLGAGIAISNSKVSDGEVELQKVISAQVPNAVDYRIVPFKDIYDDKNSKEDIELRTKITKAIENLKDSNELKIGDFKPVVLLKGNDAIIGIKHPDNTISLVTFDMSGKEIKKIHNEKKEVK
ncbi:MAG: hypothetical protein M0021_04730 [Clostridia bacterium]|nr:hypothetical protein [Clostridia bacterium]